MKITERDNTTLTGTNVLRRPRNLAVLVLFYITLVMVKMCLISVIRINSATVMNEPLHWRMLVKLYHTRALLNFKDR